MATTEAIARAILTACRAQRIADWAAEQATLARLQASDGDQASLDRAIEAEITAETTAEDAAWAHEALARIA